MAIAFDAVSTGMNPTDPSSLTWSHTTTTNSNRILIVGTSTESDTGGHTAQTVSGITYGSIAGTNLTSGSADAGSFASFNSASISPSSNNLILLAVTIRNGSSTQPTAPTISGNGLTWVQVNSVGYDTSGTSRRSVYVFRAMGSSPSSGAVTVTFGETETAYAYSIDQFSGVDTSGTNGSGAIVQSATNKDETPPTGLTVTLSAFSNLNNATYGAFGESNGYAQSAGSGFTELSSPESSTEIGALAEWKSSNDTSVDYSLGANTSQMGGVAIEIKAANPLQTLTKIRSDYITDSGTELWYLVAPATGVNNIVVTMTGTVDGLFGAGLSFTGVDQTNPIDANTGTTTTGTSISQNITTVAANAMIVNIVHHFNSSSVLTADANQTEKFNTPTTGDNDQAGGIRLVTTATSYTTSWTADINDGMTLSIVSLKPASGTSYTPTYTETMTLVDTIPRATSRNLTEAVTYVDTVLKNPARILTDVTILVDTIVRAPGKLQSEVMTLVDTYSRVWITSRTFEETTTLVDTVPKSTSRTLSDQASLIDTIVFSTGKVLTEAMTLVDTITKSISRTLTDASTLVDTLEKNAGRLLSEAITLVDSLIRSVGRFLLEVVTMVDSIIKSISRTLSEALSLVDVLVREILRYLSDFLSMVDTFISELISTNYSAILTETMTLVDNIEKLFNHIISGIPTTIRHLAQIRPFGFLKDRKPSGSLDDVKPEGSSGKGIENGISLKDNNKPSMM